MPSADNPRAAAPQGSTASQRRPAAHEIATLLVANRGEIARRIFRTCRELGIATVAVFSDADADAPFVAEADVAVALGGTTAAESYLRQDALIDAARRAGADAIHPGYGFLAENAAFAAAVIEAGLTWVGPSPEAIAAMGSKIEAKQRMAAAGVPVLPGATVAHGADPAPLAASIGFPLLAKASAGGGGKGMRIVHDAAALAGAVAAARREAQAAFGDDTLFLERYVEDGRHVEIQILGDSHGRVIALGERECSIQRRHQKVIEEAPSPAVAESLRSDMEAAAVAAGEALGYVGAGTVEFLLDTGDRSGPPKFYFLEVNTRLQVEHPVTELVRGIDLVALQLAVASGEPVPEVAPIDGHAIEARLYAEDPANDYLPMTGTLVRFAVGEGVRVDTGVHDGSTISPYYDPMIAKVIAWAPTRVAAARKLARALRGAELHGLAGNRDLLVRVLEHEAFLAGDTDTGFLDRHAGELLEPLLDRDAARLAAAAAALAGAAGRRAAARVQRTLPSGWRNIASQDQEVVYESPRGALPVRYRFDRSGRALAALAVDGEDVPDALLRSAAPAAVVLQAGGVRRAYRVASDGERVWVNSAEGQLDLVELPRHPLPGADEAPGSLKSPMPGAVLRVAAAAGDVVERGTVLLVLEAMKMEHEVTAPAAGTVAEIHVTAGQQVDAGALLAVIDESSG